MDSPFRAADVWTAVFVGAPEVQALVREAPEIQPASPVQAAIDLLPARHLGRNGHRGWQRAERAT